MNGTVNVLGDVTHIMHVHVLVFFFRPDFTKALICNNKMKYHLLSFPMFQLSLFSLIYVIVDYYTLISCKRRETEKTFPYLTYPGYETFSILLVN